MRTLEVSKAGTQLRISRPFIPDSYSGLVLGVEGESLKGYFNGQQVTHEGERMSTEIPIWVNGKMRWLSGIDKKTTCKDVVQVLLDGEGLNKSEAKDFAIMERWRKVERQLDENSKILKIWTHWGSEKKEVRLCLRRIDNEVDSGRGSPIGTGYIPSLRRKRNRVRGNEKPPWAYKETLHPRRLAELGRFAKKEFEDYPHVKTKQSEVESLNDTNLYDKIYEDKNIYNKATDTENASSRKVSGHKSYHCSGTGRLHSTPFSSSKENHSRKPKCCSKRDSKQKIRNSENIEKLMKLILAQGATIQSQLQKLKEREEQIELLEQERHRERIEKNGRNYLLETYLGSLKDAEIPEDLNLEGSNETTTKAENPDRTHLTEAETSLNKSSNIYGRAQAGHREEENRVCQSRAQHKSARSKSESRAQEGKLERNLKRTLSDNSIAETSSAGLACGEAKEFSTDMEQQITKDDYEDVVELRRIQSQIEMWEKVFKINKKLEKEEENLVRLHIKIKKIQSENYKIAKEKLEDSEKAEQVSSSTSENSHPEISSSNKTQYERDCAELEKNLETLKTDLEHNSKEIYKNFTKLIEEDELVAQKRSCLSQIITDLERTDHEHDMLNEMVSMRQNVVCEPDKITAFCETTSDLGDKSLREGLPKEETQHTVPQGFRSDNFYTNALNLPQIQNSVNQRTEVNVDDQEVLFQMKPKNVKISFEDKIEKYENSDTSREKLVSKDSLPVPVPTGALKSILKNRRNCLSKTCNLNNEFQNYQMLSQNYELNNDRVPENLSMSDTYIQNYYPHSADVPETINSTYPYTIPYPLYVNFSNEHNQVFNGQLPKLTENLKSSCLLKNTHPQEITRTPFPHSTVVTTKALVHNDTDSSTSSDTSGLSSMYSSSTVEEPYVEKSYALDTLV